MAAQTYTEEDLQGKKYNELLKISKAYGIKPSKRLKTEKLVEAILKCQREEDKLPSPLDTKLPSPQDTKLPSPQDTKLPSPQDTKLPSPQDTKLPSRQDTKLPSPQDTKLPSPQDTKLPSPQDTKLPSSQDTKLPSPQDTKLPSPQKTHTLLDDEMLLDIKFPECDFKDSLDATFDADKESSETDGETASPGDRKSHQRRGTYDLEDGEETQETVTGKKRQRSSTFDLSESTDVARPIDEKQTAKNSSHLNSLIGQVTVRAGRRTTKAPSRTQPASPWQANTSLSALPKRQRRSVTVTTSAPAPLLRSSTQQRRSRGTPAALAKPSATTTTATATATTTKPVFTIGCGDEKMAVENTQPDKQGIQAKGASGIPRFMSYARRLKMPDFAAIHTKAFQRMEGLEDYVDRRRARQDTIGSTTKKKQDKSEEVFQPSVMSVKNLNFNFTDESPSEPQGTETSQASNKLDHKNARTPSCPETQDTVPRMPSPKSLKKATNTPRGARLSKRVSQSATKPGTNTTLSATTKREGARKSPRLTQKPSPKNTKGEGVKKISPKLARKTSPKIHKKPSPKPPMESSRTGQQGKRSPKLAPRSSLKPGTDATTGQKVKTSPAPMSVKKVPSVTFATFSSHMKENRKSGVLSVCSPKPSKLPLPCGVASPASVRKRMQEYSQGLASRGTTYVPYRGAVKPLKSREALKTLAERKHNVKSSKEIREGQKRILKGVRFNKRFELQMANRGINI